MLVLCTSQSIRYNTIIYSIYVYTQECMNEYLIYILCTQSSQTIITRRENWQ